MHRVGLIIPSSNVVVEDTLRQLAARVRENVALHIARFSVVRVNLDPGSTDQFQDRSVDQAIDQLLEAEVDQIIFAGTAGAWLGIERERAWCARAKKRAQVDVTTTTLLTIDALRNLAPANIGLVTPFKSEVHNQIIENFMSEGINISHGRFLGLELSREMAEVAPQTISDMIQNCLDNGCDCVLCFCTNFRGLDGCDLAASQAHSAKLFDSVKLTLEMTGCLTD